MVYRCTRCGEVYTKEELKELREMGEAVNMNPFLCPDCFDDFSRLALENRFDELMKNERAN